MRKLLILLFLFIFIYSNAQIAFQNLAVRKPMQIDSFTFKYTGALQQFIVPNKVTSIKVQAIGAKGGTGGYGQLGGGGANIITTINVTPGQVLYIVVGGFPGQSSTAKYGFAGNGGNANNASAFGGAGGGLSGVFTSVNPAVANALVVAGGGGGGAGHGTGADYTGGNAGNTSAGNSSNGNEPSNAQTSFIKNGRYQYGYAATNSAAGIESYAFDNYPYNDGASGSDINGGNGGAGTIWAGGGGGGAGYYGGGGGAGGGDANGGGAGGATKTTSGNSSFGTANTTGDGSVKIICFSNSGLVLNLDAGNLLSYSGSGTTWTDLSGNGSNVTLVSTTFNSANGGSIVFDGTVSSYANFNANIGTTSVVTISMWVKTNSFSGMYFGFNIYDVWTTGSNIGFNTGSGDQYGLTSTQVSNLGILNNWKHLVFVMYQNTTVGNKIYVNGVNQTLSLSNAVASNINASFNSGNGRISGWLANNSYPINMQVGNFRIYNRELNQQEITNNFSTEKNRFGL